VRHDRSHYSHYLILDKLGARAAWACIEVQGKCFAGIAADDLDFSLSTNERVALLELKRRLSPTWCDDRKKERISDSDED
jgi:hypothetical protein